MVKRYTRYKCEKCGNGFSNFKDAKRHENRPTKRLRLEDNKAYLLHFEPPEGVSAKINIIGIVNHDEERLTFDDKLNKHIRQYHANYFGEDDLDDYGQYTMPATEFEELDEERLERFKVRMQKRNLDINLEGVVVGRIKG